MYPIGNLNHAILAIEIVANQFHRPIKHVVQCISDKFMYFQNEYNTSENEQFGVVLIDPFQPKEQ